MLKGATERPGRAGLWILQKGVSGTRWHKAESAQCKHCGGAFARKTIVWGREKTAFCGRRCQNAEKAEKTKKIVTLACAHCGEPIERQHCRLRKMNFCSRMCQGLARRLEGGNPEAMPSHYGTGRRRKPAATGVEKTEEGKRRVVEKVLRQAKSRVDGRLPNEQKNAIIEVKGGRCEDCGLGFKGLLQLHHVDADLSKNEPEDLRVLCVFDHALRHFKKVDGGWKFSTRSLTPLTALDELRSAAKEARPAAAVFSRGGEKSAFVRGRQEPQRKKAQKPRAGHCAFCGGRLVGARSSKKKFCDLICSAEARKKRTEVECDFCGSFFGSWRQERTKNFIFAGRSANILPRKKNQVSLVFGQKATAATRI
jgi:hypothetical protein